MKIAILSMLLYISGIAAAGHERRQEQKSEPAPPPSFALKDLRGRTVRLEDFKGKVVMLNFWATWCAPCRAEMPELVKWQSEHGARGLQVVGVTYPPESPARVRRLAAQLKINYPILFGTEESASLYGVGEVLPVTVIIDREGRVRGRVLGVIYRDEFEEMVMPLLK